jgi:hypothetical protein
MGFDVRMSYGEAVAFGIAKDAVRWYKIGYTPTMTTAVSDIWSAAGLYVFPTAAAGMELLSSDNTNDIGTSLYSGTSTGGSMTTLVDSGKDFTAATAVAAGDYIILDKSGTTPEWGIVTAVTATTLTVANGFSGGGVGGGGRAYAVLDNSVTTGAQAVRINYLDGFYMEHDEIVIMNGTTVVPTVNTNIYRINSFRVIAAGSTNAAVGGITLRNLADTPIYGFITATYTRSRSIMYTVPLGKTLWITQINVGYAWIDAAKAQNQYCRFWTRANRDPQTNFRTGTIFYPYTEILSVTGQVHVPLLEPTPLIAKTDIRVSGIATAAGVATCALRGYLVSS